MQNLFDLDGRGASGQLKVTIAQFFRINGEGTQHRGVVPDIIFPTARDSKSHGERALENALPWASIRPARYRPTFPAIDFSRARRLHEGRVRENIQFQILLAEIESQRRIADRVTVTLLEAKRKEEQENRREERSRREQQLQQTPAVPEASHREGDDSKAAAGPASGTKDGPQQNVVLREAGRILVDVAKEWPGTRVPWVTQRVKKPKPAVH